MKTFVRVLVVFFTALSCGLFAQQTLSDADILKMYQGLRVADVSDGLDMVGLRDNGLMHQSIEPLWKDIDNMSHIIAGIAVTARYVPTMRVIKNPMEAEEFRQWEGNWYGTYSTEPFVEHLKEGSIVVLDVQGDGDTGSVGSNNILSYVAKGARGVISNGGVRDTDEIIKQRVPVYFDPENRGRGIRPGRNEIESVQKPVVIAGVLINPGDVIVADGDGVVVVPRAHAERVAEYARGILDGDKASRKRMYEQLGIPLDQTVR